MDDIVTTLEDTFYRRHHYSEQDAKERQQPFQTNAHALAAIQWRNCIHKAFYGTLATRGTNKFLELESILYDLMVRVSRVAKPEFWEFAVHLVLLLAREPEQQQTEQVQSDPMSLVADGKPIMPPSPMKNKTKMTKLEKKKQTKRNKTQPNSPLAFLVVNALKKLTEDEDVEQARHCHHEGRTNHTLRAFCISGLENPSIMDQKLLVEVIDLFQLNDFDIDLIRRAADNLLATKNYTPLIKLVDLYLTMTWPFESMIQFMTRSKDWVSAELMVRTFERPGEIDMLYNRDGLMKLIEKQRWQIALSFVGSDATLQKILLDHMVAAGEIQHAIHLAQRLGLDNFKPDVSQIASHTISVTNRLSQSTNTGAFIGVLELPLEDEKIVFCNTEESVKDAMLHFFGDDGGEEHDEEKMVHNGDGLFQMNQVVGLDVEWKPISTKIATATGSITTTAVASILQIASMSRVFIIDLLALHDNDYLLEIFLPRLFHSHQLLKVGFGFASDLKVLHQTFPERPMFLSVSPFLELNSVLVKSFGASAGKSLSNATNRIVGKPLDKKMQLSDWDARPLSRPQLQYAALDAFCLVQIIAKFSHTRQLKQHGDLPSWKKISRSIGELVHSSPLIGDAADEAVNHRKQYQENWRNRSTMKSSTQTSELLTPKDIHRYWDERKSSYSRSMVQHKNGEMLDLEIKFLPVETAKELLDRSQDPSAPDQFLAVNSICFFADENPCVACINANYKLDTAQLALLCGVSRRRIKLATANQCEEIFGFSPGTVPPFGHGYRSAPIPEQMSLQSSLDIKIYADICLQNANYLIAGSGSYESLLLLSSAAFFALIQIEAVGDIQRGLPSAATRPLPDLDDTSDGEREDVEALEYRFLADSMVARVGKWLRTIGIDVIIWDPYAVPKKTTNQDHKSALLALAVKEHRIVITRDKRLANRRDAGACFVVSSDNPYQQFQEIKNHFALQLKKDEMMTRCARCNSKSLKIVDVDFVRNQTEEEVYENILHTVDEFWVCTECHKIYWEGPKYASAYDNLLSMFDEQSIIEFGM